MQENKEGAAVELAACAERLAGAAELLEKMLAGVQAQYETLNAKVDRIVAAVEERVEASGADDERVARLERECEELKAQSQKAARKTLAPTVAMLLTKSGVEAGAALEESALDKALTSLSIEQRIAVKAEMARAGLIA